MKNNREKGFTLIELVIVIAILGILMAIAVPAYNNVAKTAKLAQAKAAANQINLYVKTQGMDQMMRNGIESYPDATANILANAIGGNDPAAAAAWEEVPAMDSPGAGANDESRVFYQLVSDNEFMIGYLRGDDPGTSATDDDYLVFYLTGGSDACTPDVEAVEANQQGQGGVEGEDGACDGGAIVGQGEGGSIGMGSVKGHS